VAQFKPDIRNAMAPDDVGRVLTATTKEAEAFIAQRERFFKLYGINKTALAEGSGQAGGYAVPPQFSTNLLMLAIEESIFGPRASKFPMTSLTAQLPSLDVTTVQGAGNTPILGGINAVWSSEAATRKESEPALRMTDLKAHECSFYAVASNTLLADQAVGLDTLLTMLFQWAIAWYTDYAFFNGNGVGKPLGVLQCPALIKVTRAGGAGTSTVAYSDVATMLSKLYCPFWRGAGVAWVMHQSLLPKLLQITDPAGRVVFIPLDKGLQEPLPQSSGVWSVGWMFGIPVLVSEKVPALGGVGDLGLYSFPHYILGQRMELQIDVSPHVNFLTNQLVWRVLWRGDGQPWLNNPITLADGSFTCGPFVALN
jgi:HK97 family phage major capsid protein